MATLAAYLFFTQNPSHSLGVEDLVLDQQGHDSRADVSFAVLSVCFKVYYGFLRV